MYRNISAFTTSKYQVFLLYTKFIKFIFKILSQIAQFLLRKKAPTFRWLRNLYNSKKLPSFGLLTTLLACSLLTTSDVFSTILDEGEGPFPTKTENEEVLCAISAIDVQILLGLPPKLAARGRIFLTRPGSMTGAISAIAVQILIGLLPKLASRGR